MTGSYAEWISTHPEVLGSVIPLMLQGVKDTELAQPATLSLKEVVRENQDHILPFVGQILTASKVCNTHIYHVYIFNSELLFSDFITFANT